MYAECVVSNTKNAQVSLSLISLVFMPRKTNLEINNHTKKYPTPYVTQELEVTGIFYLTGSQMSCWNMFSLLRCLLGNHFFLR